MLTLITDLVSILLARNWGLTSPSPNKAVRRNRALSTHACLRTSNITNERCVPLSAGQVPARGDLTRVLGVNRGMGRLVVVVVVFIMVPEGHGGHALFIPGVC